MRLHIQALESIHENLCSANLHIDSGIVKSLTDCGLKELDESVLSIFITVISSILMMLVLQSSAFEREAESGIS